MNERTPVEFVPVQGVNVEIPSVMLGEVHASFAKNMLFERMVLRTRPALVPGGSWSANSPIDFVKSFSLDGGGPYVVALARDGKIYKAGPTTEITGAGTSFGAKEYHNAKIINGLIVIGNNETGMIKHDPSAGSTYTIEADPKYRYFTGMFSRFVGANYIESGSENPRRIGWSVSGDETDWSSAGAGANTLVEIPDDITGLESIHNTLIVLRRTGFTFGYPTGVSTPAIRFENFTREGIGVEYPSTVVVYDLKVYFVSKRNVYVIGLDGNPEPIGTPIRRMLIGDLSRGIDFKAFITEGDLAVDEDLYAVPKHRYHLVPIDAPAGTAHYCYDIEEDLWSVHTYKVNTSTAYEGSWGVGHKFDQLTLIDDSDDGNQYAWRDKRAYPDDQDSVVVTKPLVMFDKSRVYSVHELLFVWRLLEADETNPGHVSITVSLTHNNNRTEVIRIFDVSKLTTGERDEWFIHKMSIEKSGQLPRVRLSVPSGVRLMVSGITLYVTELGDSSSGVATGSA